MVRFRLHLKIGPTGFLDRWHMQCGREGEKNKSKDFYAFAKQLGDGVAV